MNFDAGCGIANLIYYGEFQIDRVLDFELIINDNNFTYSLLVVHHSSSIHHGTMGQRGKSQKYMGNDD